MLLARQVTKVASQRRTVACSAANDAVARRAALVALPALFLAPKAAQALIPDEEDEDLLEKAKANRRSRLEQQRGVTREFLGAENIKDKSIASNIGPVQLGVLELEKTGAALEAGDLKAAGATLAESWVAEFGRAATAISSTDAAQSVVAGLSGLQAAVSSGDLKGSKQQYVTAITALEAWATASGVTSSIKGL